MLDMKKVLNVKNRSTSTTVYKVYLDNGQTIRRVLTPGEVIKVQYEELFKLSNKPGGKELIANYLQIAEAEALEEMQIRTEPEYNMSEQDVIALICNGSLDAFLDCLDFAPTGVIDLIKNLAIALPMNDSAKREALKNKTGFDVDAALKNKKAAEAEDAGAVEAPTATRRVQETSTTGRRTESKYKSVTIKEN